eukprot:scaffold13699_cov157-Isochrysis_galbana.AAC.2
MLLLHCVLARAGCHLVPPAQGSAAPCRQPVLQAKAAGGRSSLSQSAGCVASTGRDTAIALAGWVANRLDA